MVRRLDRSALLVKNLNRFPTPLPFTQIPETPGAHVSHATWQDTLFTIPFASQTKYDRAVHRFR